MNIKLWACTICLAAIVIQSCEYNELPEPVPISDDCPEEISYSGQIQDIVNTTCAVPTCHNGSLGEDRNWTILSSLQAKKDNVKDRINRPPGTPGRMPAAGALTPAEIEVLTCWVNQGARNN